MTIQRWSAFRKFVPLPFFRRVSSRLSPLSGGSRFSAENPLWTAFRARAIGTYPLTIPICWSIYVLPLSPFFAVRAAVGSSIGRLSARSFSVPGRRVRGGEGGSRCRKFGGYFHERFHPDLILPGSIRRGSPPLVQPDRRGKQSPEPCGQALCQSGRPGARISA